MQGLEHPARLDWNWIDAVTAVSDPERTIEGFRRIGPSEWYLEHHFPGFPVVPGVFVTEMMAHAVGVVQTLRARRRGEDWPSYVLVAVDELRFYSFARPGDRIDLAADLLEDDPDEVIAKASAASNGKRMARCRITLRRVDVDADEEGARGAAGPRGVVAYLRRVLPPDLRERYGLGPA